MYWNLTDKERLFTAFTLADNATLLQKFMSDFFTPQEIGAYALRLKALCMFNDGATYKQIQFVTKLSPVTIARLSKRMADNTNGVQEIIRKFKAKGNGRTYFD